MKNTKHGIRRGMHCTAIGAYFLWGEDTRFTTAEGFCPQCKAEVQTFCVPPWKGNRGKTVLCVHCKSIVSKSARFGAEASSNVPVDFDFVDGFCELGHVGHYCRTEPARAMHCGEPMVRYLVNQVNENVVEHIYECRTCLQERLVRFLKA